MSAPPVTSEFPAGRWASPYFFKGSTRGADEHPRIGWSCDRAPRASHGPPSSHVAPQRAGLPLPHTWGRCLCAFCSEERPLHLSSGCIRIQDPGRPPCGWSLNYFGERKRGRSRPTAWSTSCSPVALASGVHQCLLNDSLNAILGSL